MTVLNTASDGTFNVLIVLFRALRAHGPVKREYFLSLCGAGADPNPDRLRQTLRRWTDLGLFAENEDAFCLAPDIIDDGLILPARHPHSDGDPAGARS